MSGPRQSIAEKSDTIQFDFPYEIMMFIFGNLDLHDLQSIRIVCSVWKVIAEDAINEKIKQHIAALKGSTLWQYLDAIANNGIIVDYVNQFMPENTPFLEHLTLATYCQRTDEHWALNDPYWKNLTATNMKAQANHILQLRHAFPMDETPTLESFLKLPKNNYVYADLQQDLLQTYQALEASFTMRSLLLNLRSIARPNQWPSTTIELLFDPKFRWIDGAGLMFLNNNFECYCVHFLIVTLINKSHDKKLAHPAAMNKYGILLSKLTTADWLNFLTVGYPDKTYFNGNFFIRYEWYLEAIKKGNPIVISSINKVIVKKLLEAFDGGFPCPNLPLLLTTPAALPYINDEDFVKLLVGIDVDTWKIIQTQNPEVVTRWNLKHPQTLSADATDECSATKIYRRLSNGDISKLTPVPCVDENTMANAPQEERVVDVSLSSQVTSQQSSDFVPEGRANRRL